MEENKYLTIAILIIGLIILLPLTICDLVFGFNEDECLTIYPDYIHINLKRYLLVSGFMQTFMLLFFIYEVLSFKYHYKSNKLLITIIIQLIFNMFMLIWNIIGAIIFWDYVYKYGHCEKNVSDYIFASIIIKIILTYISMKNNKHD